MYNSTCDALHVDSTMLNNMRNDDKLLSHIQKINTSQVFINLNSYKVCNDYINVNSDFNKSILNVANKDNNIDFTLDATDNILSLIDINNNLTMI